MLSFEQLTFIIDEKTLFTNMNISFLPSSIIYLQGPNGCGKTSLLRMVANIQNPSAGNILYRYFNINDIPKPYCNYIGHNLGLKSQITVLEHLKFWSRVYNSVEILQSAIHYFKLHDILNEKCYKLSAGNQKKIAITKLLACHSNLWLLDEVDSNLDQENKEFLYNLIVTKANNGGIIIFTSHSSINIKTTQIINLPEYRKIQ